MKKNRKYFNKSILPPLIVLVLLFAGNNIAAQQMRSVVLTNSACGTYPEKGNFLESGSVLNAGGNGCVTTITSGSKAVFFKGHDKIVLGPGFHAQAGAKFVAFIKTDSAVQALIQQELAKPDDALDNNINFLNNKASLNKTGISQNSPNPFNNNTVISYRLMRKFFSAKIVVYDGIGKIRKQINIPAQGTGTLNIDGTGLAPGIYTYSLWIDGQLTDTRKMILIK
ncbi:MAG: hypothetical protein QM802_07850 [Agriterribacter sp.]